MEKWIVALLLSVLILAPATGGAFQGWMMPAKCEVVSGEVIEKEEDAASNILWVELSFPREGIRGFRVYVSSATYDNYTVGDYYEEEVCDIQALTDIQDTISYLLDWGFIVEY